MSVKSIKSEIFYVSNLCQSEVLWFDPDIPGDGLEDFSSAGVLLAHTHQKLTHINMTSILEGETDEKHLYISHLCEPHLCSSLLTDTASNVTV